MINDPLHQPLYQTHDFKYIVWEQCDQTFYIERESGELYEFAARFDSLEDVRQWLSDRGYPTIHLVNVVVNKAQYQADEFTSIDGKVFSNVHINDVLKELEILSGGSTPGYIGIRATACQLFAYTLLRERMTQ